MQNFIWQKINSLQEEIKQLKGLPKKPMVQTAKGQSLYGFLKGVKFSESEINEAKKKLFSFKVS